MRRFTYPARVFSVTGLVMLSVLFWTLAWAESNNIPIHFKRGLPHVKVGIIGCESQRELDVVLDTGASSSIVPHECMRQLVRDRRAMELETHTVVLADGHVQEISEFLIDGIILGECELHSVRVLCCKDPALDFPPVLGVDVLRRLRAVRMQLSPEGGILTYDCPPSRMDDEDCYLNEGKLESKERDLTYTLRRLGGRGETPVTDR